jgi:hypothetical protein
MSWPDFFATILCALAGFGIVSLLMDRIKESESDASFDQGDSTTRGNEISKDSVYPKTWWQGIGGKRKSVGT